jgi:hypothetical protein
MAEMGSGIWGGYGLFMGYSVQRVRGLVGRFFSGLRVRGYTFFQPARKKISTFRVMYVWHFGA